MPPIQPETSKDVEDQRPLASRVCTGDAATWLNALCCLPVTCWHAVSIYMFPCVLAVFMAVLNFILFKPARYILGASWGAFKDRSFPPEASSIGNWTGKSVQQIENEVHWLRAPEVFESKFTEFEKKHGLRVKLFEDSIQPSDVAQGQLGNCWLVAAFACLAEHPGLIRKAFITKQVNPQGKYKVQLFDGRTRQWVVVTIDDFVPIWKRSGTHLFAQPSGRELWVLLLEKAFAKFCSTYQDLSGGSSVWAFNAVTGDPVYALARSGDKWKRQNIKFDDAKKRAISFFWTDEEYDSIDAFFLLRRLTRAKTLLGASGANRGEAKLDNGLVKGHAYSVLDVRSFVDERRTSQRINLIKLRNPWAEHEWTGAWSDGAAEWDQFPKIRSLIRPKNGNDGTFWMSWVDFATVFDRLDVCQRSTGLRDLAIDLNEGDGCNAGCIGPTRGCLLGCATYWCLCRGPLALYTGIKASDKTMEIGDHGRDDDVIRMAGAVAGNVTENITRSLSPSKQPG